MVSGTVWGTLLGAGPAASAAQAGRSSAIRVAVRRKNAKMGMGQWVRPSKGRGLAVVMAGTTAGEGGFEITIASTHRHPGASVPPPP